MGALMRFMRENSAENPLQPRHQVALVGFFFERLQARKAPSLRYASLSAYLSGIRQTHEALGLGSFPMAENCLLLRAVFTRYANSEVGTIRPTNIRIAIPPDVLYRILCSSCDSNAGRNEVRDAAMIIVATVYGLRPNSARSIDEESLAIETDSMRALVRVLKGKTKTASLSRGQRTFYFPQYAPIGYPVTVRQFLLKWRDMRGRAPGSWFDAPGLSACSLDNSVKAATSALRWTSPSGCSVGGHCPRISAFTQCVPLGWIPMRLQIILDWKTFEDMTGVYMNHNARISPVSPVFFSPEMPG